MAKKQELTHEVHDHFNKANVLHKYVSEDLGLARNHALETGQELMAAKAGCPPGSWEEECKRLFNGSARTARFYMAFAKHMGALPKTASHAVLMLEGTLEGAAKAAKAAAKPKPPKPEPETEPKEPIDVDSEPAEETGAEPATPAEVQAAVESAAEDDAEPEDYGKCPVCAGSKWADNEEGVECAKCRHPHGESTGGPDEDRIKTQRLKSRKTAEALMRAFDDLQTMKAKQEHSGTTKWSSEDAIATLKDMGVIRVCKSLLTIAEKW